MTEKQELSALYWVERGRGKEFLKGKQRFFQISPVKHRYFIKLPECPKDFCSRL